MSTRSSSTLANDDAPAPPLDVPTLADTPWHALTTEETLARLAVDLEGLDSGTAAERLQRYGPNRLPSPPKTGPLVRLLRQFHNLLIYVLLGSAGLSLLLGHLVDAGVILAVVLANAFIGFVQEGKAEDALEAIRGMIDPEASVRRAGQRLRIPGDQIVPGDIVLIEAGDRVPADLRLLRARHLKIDEAALTGESLAVEKAAVPVAAQTPLAERACMAYSGTLVATGQAIGVAIATGPLTELGRISQLVSEVEPLATPLLRQMTAFARRLTLVILAVSTGTFLFAWRLRDYAVADALMTVIGLAVAAIPEGLPAIMTVTLAIGVRRMAARHAIIRRLPAVETLGSVSVICSDKTGTLTRNEMTVHTVLAGDAAYQVSGSGYTPVGDFSTACGPARAGEDRLLHELLRAGTMCNDAALRQDPDGWRIEGDPMEGALIVLGAKAGIDANLLRQQQPRMDEIPFDAGHRFMATLHRCSDRSGVIFLKGAPERVLSMCGAEPAAGGTQPLRADTWQARLDALAAQGQRVLAFASREVGPQHDSLGFSDVEGSMLFLGLAGFIDPPREEALAAVQECRAAGIRPIMITGDHALTAGEIARQLGLADDPVVMNGEQLDGLCRKSLREALRRVSVFARTTPEHKLRLVEALQADGHVVAMTGDGVNDAPALKRADVGIAMGRKGTEAAKEASEMVLADDNFASIVHAVREGRTVYDNLMKVISWTLPTNAGEALIVISAVLLGLAVPITPIQILWINTVTAVALGLTLAFEPTEPRAMARSPRASHQPLLGLALLWRVLSVATLFLMAAYGMYYWALARGAGIETARTLVVNTVVVLEIAYLFSVRYVASSALSWQGVLGTPAVLIGVGAVTAAQFAFTYLPFMQALFDSRAVSLTEGLATVAAGLALLLIVELEKWLRRRLQAHERR